MKIVLAGSGTAGPVMPLIAIKNEILKIHPKTTFIFIGTKNGVEKDIAQQNNIKFFFLPEGKLRRYFSLKNFFTPFVTLLGIARAFRILKQEKPDVIVGAGGFIQVPVVWAGFLLGIPSLIHQQDVVPSLANKLCQFAAKKITVSFEISQKEFYSSLGFKPQADGNQKIIFAGNPVRDLKIPASREQCIKKFGFNPQLPVLLVMGGGTGSEFINNLLYSSLKELSKIMQVIHITGKRRGQTMPEDATYKNYEFYEDMSVAYKASDLVLCRAGLSTISELSVLGKVAIIIPMPKSPQEINAAYLDLREAALILPQNLATKKTLILILRKIMFKYDLLERFKTNISKIMPQNGAQKLAKEICELPFNKQHP